MIIDAQSESMLLSSFIRYPVETGGKCVKHSLTSAAFTSNEYQELYKHLLGVWAEGKKIDPHMIALDLKKTGRLALVGGAERLRELVGMTPSQHVVDELIERVMDMQQRRRILEITKKAYEDVQGDTPTGEILGDIGALLVTGDALIETPTPAELNKELIARAESTDLISTGFYTIDHDCGKLSPGDFLVIGGGAKAGKSVLTGNIARNIARNRMTVIFTIEMNRVEYWKRIVSSVAGVPSATWDKDAPEIPDHTRRAGLAMKSLESSKVTIVDRVQDIDQAMALCRAIKAAKGELGCVVFDYIQQFTSNDETGSRAEAVAAVSRKCKRGAVDLQTLVIGVSQLNDDGKSLESRGIQRDCNLMLNVLVEDDGTRDVVCAFNRNGPMGMSLSLTPEFHFCRFIES